MIFQNGRFTEIIRIRFSYKHFNFSHVCLLIKMASKTVTMSIKDRRSISDETNDSISCFLRLKSVPCKRLELIILLKFASRVECAWMQSETETGVYFITKSRLIPPIEMCR